MKMANHWSEDLLQSWEFWAVLSGVLAAVNAML
jgi:hypothetical protein